MVREELMPNRRNPAIVLVRVSPTSHLIAYPEPISLVYFTNYTVQDCQSGSPDARKFFKKRKGLCLCPITLSYFFGIGKDAFASIVLSIALRANVFVVPGCCMLHDWDLRCGCVKRPHASAGRTFSALCLSSEVRPLTASFATAPIQVPPALTQH
jgi:hypothetical protein